MSDITDQPTTEVIPVPYNWGCTHEGCPNMGIGFNTNPTTGFNKLACGDHIDSSQKFIFAHVSKMGHPAFSDADERLTIDNDVAEMKVLLKAVEPSLKQQVSNIKSNIDEKLKAERDLSRFKEKVVEEVVNWDGGCQTGKEEFLEALGLSWPMRAVTLTITFDYKGDPDDISTSDIEYYVGQSLDSDFEAICCEVDY